MVWVNGQGCQRACSYWYYAVPHPYRCIS
jgi:hypothetical protein